MSQNRNYMQIKFKKRGPLFKCYAVGKTKLHINIREDRMPNFH